MHISQIVSVSVLAITLSTPASAALRGDFAGLAMCSKLSAMPKGYRAIECNTRAPLRGECRFALTSDGIAIEYLIENGVVLDKKVSLSASAGFDAPYGLRHGDDYKGATRKIKASAGLSSQLWTDHEDETVSYLQSDDVSCGRNKSYTIYVWFSNGRAESVSVSTLPAF